MLPGAKSVRIHPSTIGRVGSYQSNPVDTPSSGFDRTSLMQEQGDPTKSNWEFHEGFIDVAIPGLNYYVATIGGGVGRVPCAKMSIGGEWGSIESQNVMPNSRALFMVDRDRSQYYVISQLPEANISESTSFPMMSSTQTCVGILFDPVLDFAATTSDKAKLAVANTSQPIDVIVGDWSVHNALGGGILVSSLTLSMFVDEVTGLWLDTIDQRAELSGRSIHIESDSIRLTNTTNVGKLQLAGKQQYVTQPELSPKEFKVEEYRQLDAPQLYVIEGGENLFSYNVYAVASGTAVSTDNYVESIVGQSLRGAQSQAFVVGNFPRFCDYGTAREDNIDVFPSTTSESDRDDTIARLKRWSEHEFLSIFNKSTQLLAQISADFLGDAENFVHLSTENVEIPTIKQDFAESESFSPGIPGVDRVLQGKLLEIDRILSFFKQLPDGSICIGMDSGASLRFCGNTVFIDCGTLRVAAAKDICFMGRDYQVLTSRNVSMQAGRHLRAYAAVNANIIGGISNRGGVLIESRGTNRDITLPANPEDAVYAGVVCRAPSTLVALQGGDIVLDAGVRSAGSILCRANEATLIQAPVVATSSQGVLLAPANPSSVASSTYITQSATVFGGDIKSRNGWFDGAVSARSNVQSFFGRMADSRGGQLSRVTNTQQFTNAINQYDEFLSNGVKSFISRQSAAAERTATDSRIVSEPVTKALSGGFVEPGAATSHYGTANMQTTTMRVFEMGRQLSEVPVRSLAVRYKELSGSVLTFGWPGNTNEIQVDTIPILKSFTGRCKAIYTAEPTAESVEVEDFGTAFGTLK